MHTRKKILLALSGLSLAPMLGTPTFAQGRATSTQATETGFNLTFVDADARQVVDAVLGAMMAVDYAIDPAVQGTVTLRTAQPAPRSALLPLLENALSSINAVVIVRDGRYQVIPREAARAQAPMAGSGGSAEIGEVTPGFATEVITLQAGNAQQIARLLREFVGEDVVANVEPALNRVVISGNAEERTAARQLIARFDVDALADMQYELVRLQNVDPDTLVAELERIFEPPFDIVGSRVRVIPLPRLRSVLLVAAQRSDITRLDPWIQRLDAGVAGSRRLYTYNVQNGRARDIAVILQRVLGVEGSHDQNDIAPPSSPSNNERAAPLPTGTDEAMDDRRPTPAGRSPADDRIASPRIVPSDETNSLIIYADGEEYAFISDALARLDQPVPQVLIEAILAEVTLNRELQYGVNFRALSGDTTITNSSTASSSPVSLFPGLSVAVSRDDAAVTLNALQARTNVRVLSSPKLVVLNNQTATLQVGDQIPIVTQQAQSTGAAGAPVINTIELRDTGVILRVTPRVNDSGTVTLDISQEVSDVARTTSSGINSPTIQQRRITSTVATRTGQMVALGGLIRDRSSDGRSGVPLLSQIPVIGGLFGTQTREATRTELIILLTPTVIRAPEDVGDVVRQLIDALDVAGPLVARGRNNQVGAEGDASQP